MLLQVLRAVLMRSGPKSGSVPGCAYVIGAIVSQAMNDAFQAMVKVDDASKMNAFVRGMLNVLQDPTMYLSGDSLSFLYRYVAGGIFLAHSRWLPRRSLKFPIDQSKKDDRIAE